MPYHHYVSAFHLAEFTRERSRDGTLWVFDKDARRRWPSSVNRVGGEQGYNAADGVPGLKPNEMEELLERRFETPAAPVLKRIIDTLELPAGKDLGILLDYFALLSVNNPARRGGMEDAQRQMLRFMAMGMLANPDTFAERQEDYRRAGVPLLGHLSPDDIRARLRDDDFVYEMRPIDHLRGFGQLHDAMAGLLKERTWSLLIADPTAPDFVCGDRPVLAIWKAERGRELASVIEGQVPQPGFAAEESEVRVPLGRRVMLVGVFGGEPSRRVAVTPMVADNNRMALGVATRFVYAADNSFVYLDRWEQLRHARDIFDRPAPTRPRGGGG